MFERAQFFLASTHNEASRDWHIFSLLMTAQAINVVLVLVLSYTYKSKMKCLEQTD